MQTKSQLKHPMITMVSYHILRNTLFSISVSLCFVSIFAANAKVEVDPDQASKAPKNPSSNIEQPVLIDNKDEAPTTLSAQDAEKQAKIKNFNNQQDAITNSQSRLGDELKSLPGPNIDFQGLLRLIITWSASLAASVAIFLVVVRSFASISGTEETHNELKTTIIKVLIGLVLIFFSYWIVSSIMGIIWAGGSIGT